MGLPPIEQAIAAIEKSTSVLIALPRNPSSDAVAASVALHAALRKRDKKVHVFCEGFEFPATHHFLQKDQKVRIQKELSQLRKFIISLDISNAEVEELSYDIQESNLKIFITPKKGFFKSEDVSTESSGYAYDLIMTLDAPDLLHLGKVAEEHSEFFYHTPTINIDHNPANENFGEINLVELTATSSSEILFELLKAIDEKLIDDTIATALLTGIISKTKSFQSQNVTPKSLSIASYLIDSGARREEIIRHLYQTKTVKTLKLWGRALARLKQDKTQTTVWTLLSSKDFEKTQASPDDIPSLVDELIINTPNAKIVMIFYQIDDTGTHLLIHTPKSIDATELFKEFQPHGSRDFTKALLPDHEIALAEKRVLEILRIEQEA